MSMLGINCYKRLKGMQFIFLNLGWIFYFTRVSVGVKVDIGLFPGHLWKPDQAASARRTDASAGS